MFLKKKIITGVLFAAVSILLVGCGGALGDKDHNDRSFDIRVPKDTTVVLDLKTGSFYPKTTDNGGGTQPAQQTDENSTEDSQYSIAGYPSHGYIYLVGNTVEYTPEKNYYGTDTAIVVEENEWESNTYTIHYNMEKTTNGSGPVISGVPPTVVNTGSKYFFQPIVSEPDGDELVFSVTYLPDWLHLDEDTGAITGVAPSQPEETGVIVITVDDGDYEDSLPPFSIKVVN